MQRVFELISSVNSYVNNLKATAKKVCRNIIITMATVISVLTVIIVSVIIDGEKKQVAGSTTEVVNNTKVVESTTEAAKENVQVVNNDVIVESTIENATEATTMMVAEVSTEVTTEAVTEQTTEVVTEVVTEAVTEAPTTAVLVEEVTEEPTNVYLSNAEVEVKDIVTSTYAPVEIYYTEADYDALLRIVQAEAGNQDDVGKILVANVIINRVKSDSYPDDIYSVITQNNGRTYQFSPVMPGGSFYWITPNEHTKECVDRALAGEDYSQGALYFCRETSSDSWFNTKLTFLFTHGPHYFYK